MKKIRKIIFLSTIAILLISSLLVFGAWSWGKKKAAGNLKIAIVVKNLGNSFFEACRDGGLEAAKELGGNIEIIYQGPSTPTAEGQIEIIDSLIAQKVDAIAVSANDVDALVPITKKAMKSGIKVISFDSGIAKDGRILQLDPSNPEFIGRSQVQILAEMINYTGEIAVLSASSQATNQNKWIEYMKEELKDSKYSKMPLVSVVYGDDLSDKSYREAMGLFKTFPNLRGIISPTTVGIAASGKAIEDAKKVGQVELTGLGLPSEMKQYIKNGTCKKMALWNPIDLGYSATLICYGLIKKDITGKEGEILTLGRMGKVKVEKDNIAVMGKPFIFDKTNIDKFAAIY